MPRVLTPAVLLALLSVGFAQDTSPISRTNRSLLQAQEEAQVLPGGFNAADHLTGDWLGARNRLFDDGVEVFGFYNSIFNGNVSGGKKPHHGTYVDDTWLGLKLDLEKLFGWRGGQFVVSGVNRDGSDLTSKYIGSIYSVQQMVGGQRPFLYQLYLQQKIIPDQLTAKLGRFGASDDFNTNPLYGYSLNNGINGNIRNVLFDTRFSAYPFSTWAAALLWNPTPEYFAKFGVFQVSQGEFENDDHGLSWGIDEHDGTLFILEVGWTPQLGKRPVPAPASGDDKTARASELKGLPGHYWAGATYSSWGGYQRFDGGFENMSYGFYVNADQMLYQEAPGSEQGLTAFAAAGYYPQETISIVPFQLNLGLNYRGLIPGRNDDRTMLHFIYGDISRTYARVTQAPLGRRAESEKVVEFAYRIQLTPWSYFQPDIQYVFNPGGTGDIQDAIVIGAQMGITF